MKKRKILLISLLTTLITPLLSSCSAGPFIPWDIPEVTAEYTRPNGTKFNEVLEHFSNAVNYGEEEQIKGYHDQLNDYLNYVLDLRENVNARKTNISEEKIGEEITFLYNYYWTLKAKEVEVTKKALKSFFHSKAVKNALGEDISNKYSSIDTTRMMINRDYVHYEQDHVTKHTEKIFANVSNEKKGMGLLLKLSEAALALFDLIEAYSICTLKSNLDVTDSYYNKEITYITNLVFSSQNEYRRAIIALINSPHRQMMEDNLGKEQVEEFLKSEVLSEELLKIQQEETELISKYATLSTEGKKLLYLALIKNRNKFFSTYKSTYPYTSYDNYAEYIYSTSFFRDYNPAQVTSLVNEISSTFADTWEKAIDVRQNIPGLVTETDLWNALEYTDNIIENGPSIREHIKDYGLYTFDSNPNSYDGAFVLTIQSLEYNDFFMLVNTSNTLNDYTTAIHEFGHYYSNMVEDETLSTSMYPSLDLSEINSQALEMLMMEHYDNFMTGEEADALRKNQVGNALWALFSGSAVSEFENYVYTLNNPTIDILDKKWDELKTKYNLNDYELSYEMIPHIYQQPCYYISYVTSIISSLELWSLPKEQARETYNNLAKLGSYNEYIKTLNSNGLSSPFNNINLLEKLNSKLDSLL